MTAQGVSSDSGEETLFAINEWVLQDHDDRVPMQEHLGDVVVLVDCFGLLHALATLGDLSPHLLQVLQCLYIAVPVEGLHMAQEFLLVVAVELSTWVLSLTDCVSTEIGPMLNSSFSCFCSSLGSFHSWTC